MPPPLRAAVRMLPALLGTRLGPALLRTFFRATFTGATFTEADTHARRDAVLRRLDAVPQAVARRIVAAAFGYDGAAALDAVRVPAAVVRANIPVRLRLLPPHVRGHAITGAGHWVHVHRPREVGGVLDGLVAAVRV
ncbi:hypothetical protein AB0C07_07465 [Actinoplanes missouriensis]|uniref:hypothetical protein n=1 Tax=Actinoplanes missouriensis TaxID=1866 RepID=UPI0033D963FA